MGGTAVDRRDDATLVRAAVAGEPDAFGVLFERWFDRAFDLAWRIVRNRDTAADVAQEAFLSAWRQLAGLRQPESFGGWLLRIARNQALNRLEREGRARPTDQDDVTMMADLRTAGADASEPAATAENDDLVWAAAAALGPRDASLLDLHLRHGLGAPELAAELDITPNNAHQLLFRLKGKLAGAIRGWVLWKGGRPVCDALAGALTMAGISSFGADAVKLIERHTSAGCEACTERQELRLSPEALFAGVPIVAAGPFLRERAAHALQAQGVPISSVSVVTVEAVQVVEAVDPPDGKHHPVRRGLVAIAATVVLAIVALVVLAETVGHDDEQAPSAVVVEDDKDDELGDVLGPRSTTAPPLVIVKPETTTTSTTTTAPPAGETTTTTGTITTTTAAAPPPAPPEIASFAATPNGQNCSGGAGGPPAYVVVLSWSATEWTSASISPQPGAVSGSPVTACATPGTTFTLTVSGPGGTDTATAAF